MLSRGLRNLTSILILNCISFPIHIMISNMIAIGMGERGWWASPVILVLVLVIILILKRIFIIISNDCNWNGRKRGWWVKEAPPVIRQICHQRAD